MIEGLHFDFEAKELERHLDKKAEHHLVRWEWYDVQITKLEAGGMKDEQVTGGNPLQNMKERRDKHLARKEFFELLRDHLVKGETYRLSEPNLVNIELISRYL